MLEFGQLEIEFRTFVESQLFEKSGFGDCRRRGAAGPTGAAGLGPLFNGSVYAVSQARPRI